MLLNHGEQFLPGVGRRAGRNGKPDETAAVAQSWNDRADMGVMRQLRREQHRSYVLRHLHFRLRLKQKPGSSAFRRNG